jgi:hypothetical protein
VRIYGDSLQSAAAFEIIHRNPCHEIGTGDQLELYFESSDINEAETYLKKWALLYEFRARPVLFLNKNSATLVKRFALFA